MEQLHACNDELLPVFHALASILCQHVSQYNLCEKFLNRLIFMMKTRLDLELFILNIVVNYGVGKIEVVLHCVQKINVKFMAKLTVYLLTDKNKISISISRYLMMIISISYQNAKGQ